MTILCGKSRCVGEGGIPFTVFTLHVCWVQTSVHLYQTTKLGVFNLFFSLFSKPSLMQTHNGNNVVYTIDLRGERCDLSVREIVAFTTDPQFQM